MYFIYFLRSLSNPDKTYIGYTNNLIRRLDEHNTGQSTYTSRFMPWEIRAFALADNEDIAQTVESYFKNSSGQEKFKKFEEINPIHPNHIRGYFDSLQTGHIFGRSSFQVKENQSGIVIFSSCP